MMRQTWQEFHNNGMGVKVNETLQNYGWSIVFEFDEFGIATNAYPSRIIKDNANGSEE